MPRADERPLFSGPPSLLKLPAGPPIKPAEGKRLTLPLEDRLVLAELRDLIVGDMDSRLERVAVASERTAVVLERIANAVAARFAGDATRVINTQGTPTMEWATNDGKKIDMNEIPF